MRSFLQQQIQLEVSKFKGMDLVEDQGTVHNLKMLNVIFLEARLANSSWSMELHLDVNLQGNQWCSSLETRAIMEEGMVKDYIKRVLLGINLEANLAMVDPSPEIPNNLMEVILLETTADNFLEEDLDNHRITPAMEAMEDLEVSMGLEGLVDMVSSEVAQQCQTWRPFSFRRR